MRPRRRPAARRVADIAPFVVMDVLSRAHALESRGRRIVHLEIGEPDFTAPPPVVEAARRALRDGRSAYTAALGIPALREAIAAHYGRALGVRVSASRIAVTAGASGGLLVTLAAYVGPGDEVLVPDPGYPAYRHMVRAFEGRARPLRVTAADRFQPTLELVRAAWTRRTRGVLLGSPANPTGTCIDRGELRRIAAFVAQRGGVLIVDEIYQGLVYGGAPETALGLPGEVVVVNSFSKYFCMTGWRLGWVVLPDAARLRAFEKLAQHLFICAPSIAQHAALACFAPATLRVLEARRREFQRRRDFFVPALERAGFRIPAPPTGAFYVYAQPPARDGRRPGGRQFAIDLLEKAGVAATPGVDFGANGTSRHIRFAYTRSMDDLERAAARIARFAASGDD